MNTGPAFWLIMTVGGTVLLGVALAYGLISTQKRRNNPLAQRLTDAATREVYDEEEVARRQAAGAPLGEGANITKARQGVTGHNVNVVLATSLALAVLAGIGLYAFLAVMRG